ncbi:MAG TPA: hypothetical protein VNA69_14890 [Thermoanaerobaculia bacterium]|nr:hypothetical protein [Thermoanaerobaculia bacterium]
MRKVVLLAALALALATVSATPTKKKASPAPVAPAILPHGHALFLTDLSNDGRRQVVFRANAAGTRFFFEEPSGVTVYRFQSGQYVKEEFLAGARLAAATKKYAALR